MFSIMFSGVSVATLLIALALGYVVCSIAGKEEGSLKKLGYALGSIIIVLSCLLLIGKLAASATIYSKICKLKKSHPQFMLREQAPAEKPATVIPKK